MTAIRRAEGGEVSITAAGDVLFDAAGADGGAGRFRYQIEDGHGGRAWTSSGGDRYGFDTFHRENTFLPPWLLTGADGSEILTRP